MLASLRARRTDHYAVAMTRTRLALLAMILVATVAGGTASAPAADNSDLAKLERARTLWNKQHVRDYSFRVTLSCFCPADVRKPVIVTVRKGRPHGAPASHREIDTFPEMFARIATTLTNPNSGGARVRYDAHRGFPRSASLDPIKGAVDDELSWTVDRFRVLRKR
jgi:Family of unknown function (DUF6174)